MLTREQIEEYRAGFAPEDTGWKMCDQAIAAIALREALLSVYDWACEVSDEYIDGDNLRKEYAADLKSAREAIAALEDK